MAPPTAKWRVRLSKSDSPPPAFSHRRTRVTPTRSVRRISAVSRLYLGCISGLLTPSHTCHTYSLGPPHLGCISAVSRLHLGRISAASRLYLGRISAASRPHIGRISTASPRCTTRVLLGPLVGNNTTAGFTCTLLVWLLLYGGWLMWALLSRCVRQTRWRRYRTITT